MPQLDGELRRLLGTHHPGRDPTLVAARRVVVGPALALCAAVNAAALKRICP